MELPSLPQVLIKLLERCDDGEVRVRELARVIGKDPALSAKVLEVGSRMGSRTRPDRPIFLLHALRTLGAGAIQSIAIGASGHPVLLRHGAAWRSHSYRLWLRALTCAHLAQLLAELDHYPRPREAYFGGLFHNIGQLVLGAQAPEQYPKLLAVAYDGAKLARLELSHFDIDHYNAGANLIESWRLRSFVADAVRYQAESADNLRDAHPLIRIVNLARGLSAADDERAAAIETAANLFPHVEPERLRSLAHDAVERVGEDAQALGIPVNGGDAHLDTESTLFELADRVRDVAILTGITRPLNAAQDTSALGRTVQYGAEILLGAQSSRLLFYDAEQGNLRAIVPGIASEFRLPVEEGGSLAARALRDDETLLSVDAQANGDLVVADRQLLKLLNAEAMLCAPLIARGVRAGVIVLGLNGRDLPYSSERLALLRRLGRHAAAAIAALGTGAGAPDAEFGRHVRQSVHEARNPLTTVQNYVRILASKHADEDWAERDLKIIGEEIERIDGILVKLTDVLHGQASVPGAVALNRVIADIAWLHQRSDLDERHIHLRLDLARDVPLVAVDPDELKQVIVNLIKNAADAMPGGGEINIRTRGHVNVNGRMYVEMVVGDTGSGVPPELMGTLFERGTTSKGESRGLGLAIVSELVEGWQGSVSCRSEPGEGTRFHVLLPYREPEHGATPEDGNPKDGGNADSDTAGRG
jgi:signal transduction histidine kinase/HD-like signal output (HDOD) protein